MNNIVLEDDAVDDLLGRYERELHRSHPSEILAEYRNAINPDITTIHVGQFEYTFVEVVKGSG